MEYSDNNKQIAQILYDKIKTLPIGTEISVSELSLIALEEHQTEDGFPMLYARHEHCLTGESPE